MDNHRTNPGFELKKLALEIALNTRKFEIELFWRRSLFFWTFIAAAFAGYGVLSQNNDHVPALLISCFGFVCSVAWSLINRGSKYWQENWEQKVNRFESLVFSGRASDIVGRGIFAREPILDKGRWLSAQPFSVSKVVIALSDFTWAAWLLLIVWELTQVPVSFWLLGVASIVFVGAMMAYGRTSDEIPGS